ncbi:neurogenic differentiation factor 1-like [Macrobrachium rosenbergii]|uniref:neurogenic differentiation factor 1-like n=1 Tax=Macrobrachium rosenbergii TaxID=79674 RepID=UPI0034D3A5AC
MAKTLDDVLGCDDGKRVTDDNNNTQSPNDQDMTRRRGSKRRFNEVDDAAESNPNEGSGFDDKTEVEEVHEGCQDRKSTSGKYQLRPRSHHPRRLSDSDWNFQDPVRSKTRHPPLSRYRRKTANARERYRMKQINSAFENLRGVLPSWVSNRRPPSDMTKIATLRLAAAYIRSLQDILDGKDPGDTCSWVLSALLDDSNSSKQNQPHPTASSANDKCQLTNPPDSDPDTDLVSLLCAPPESGGVSQDNLDTFSYLTPMAESEAMALLLGGEHPPWSESSTVSLV